MFASWGLLVARHPKRVIAMATVVFALTLAILVAGGDLHGPQDVNLEAGQANDLINRELPHGNNGSSFLLLLSSDKLTVDDPSFAAAVAAAVGALRGDPRVLDVLTPFDKAADKPAALVSKDRHTALAMVDLRDAENASMKYYPALRNLVHSDTLRVLATGGGSGQQNLNKDLHTELGRAAVGSIPLNGVLPGFGF